MGFARQRTCSGTGMLSGSTLAHATDCELFAIVPQGRGAARAFVRELRSPVPCPARIRREHLVSSGARDAAQCLGKKTPAAPRTPLYGADGGADHANKRQENGGSGPRTVALVGPYGSGKTTLLESILSITGAIQRKGSVAAEEHGRRCQRRSARPPDERGGQLRHHEISWTRVSPFWIAPAPSNFCRTR